MVLSQRVIVRPLHLVLPWEARRRAIEHSTIEVAQLLTFGVICLYRETQLAEIIGEVCNLLLQCHHTSVRCPLSSQRGDVLALLLLLEGRQAFPVMNGVFDLHP